MGGQGGPRAPQGPRPTGPDPLQRLAPPPPGLGPGNTANVILSNSTSACQIQPGKLSIACGAPGGGRAPVGGQGGPRAPQGPRPTGPDPLQRPAPPPPGLGPGNTANVILSNSTSACPTRPRQVVYSLRCAGRGKGPGGRAGRSQGPPGPQAHRTRPPTEACAAPPGGGPREHRERHPVQLDLGLPLHPRRGSTACRFRPESARARAGTAPGAATNGAGPISGVLAGAPSKPHRKSPTHRPEQKKTKKNSAWRLIPM